MRRFLIAIIILSALALLPGGALAADFVGPFEGPATSDPDLDPLGQNDELIQVHPAEVGNSQIPNVNGEHVQSLWFVMIAQPDSAFFDLLAISENDISPGETYLWVIDHGAFASELVNTVAGASGSNATAEDVLTRWTYDGSPGFIQ